MSSLKYRLAAAPYRAAKLFGLAPRARARVAYVIEKANWSIAWDGAYIRRGIDVIVPGLVELTTRPERLANRVVHFGSQFQWLAWADVLSSSNRYVVTFFHGKREDGPAAARHIDAFLASVPRLTRVVTACRLAEDRLLSWGVPREKLVRIPIAIDLDLFRPVTPERRRQARARYGIPDDHLVIGSFQKDGVGWEDGAEPKLIKGPDVLVDVITRVAKERRVFVLLTGPARGYVKHGLDRIGVPYAHDYVEDYLALPDRYAALDIYLNPSREEGGPKGIIEAMASGIPVVSTAVGMAPEIIGTNEAGRIAAPGDVAALAEAILDIDINRCGRAEAISIARNAVAHCAWSQVARRHYEEVYKPLITAR
jgi:glycosyltransferase involved in cell wall biosynthesis